MGLHIQERDLAKSLADVSHLCGTPATFSSYENESKPFNCFSPFARERMSAKDLIISQTLFSFNRLLPGDESLCLD